MNSGQFLLESQADLLGYCLRRFLLRRVVLRCPPYTDRKAQRHQPNYKADVLGRHRYGEQSGRHHLMLFLFLMLLSIPAVVCSVAMLLFLSLIQDFQRLFVLLLFLFDSGFQRLSVAMLLFLALIQDSSGCLLCCYSFF